jgi:hypothetical protein
MHISKTDTPDFAAYKVVRSVPARGLWKFAPGGTRLEEVRGVVEADDDTGLLVRQVYERAGCALHSKPAPVYTNGADDITLTDAVRLLLLLPGMQQAFLTAGYRPKLVTVYDASIQIVPRAAPAFYNPSVPPAGARVNAEYAAMPTDTDVEDEL